MPEADQSFLPGKRIHLFRLHEGSNAGGWQSSEGGKMMSGSVYQFDPQRIIKLTAENIKRLKAVEIVPKKDKMVVVGGMNGQGKSSVLDAIMYAITGKSSMPSIPVREGEKEAKIEIVLDDLIITRTITATGGGSLKVTNRDGLKYPSPQDLLDGLCSKISFDPLEFMRMNEKERFKSLMTFVGLDFSDLNDEYQRVYEKRTDINRKVKQIEGTLLGSPAYPDVPDDPIDVVHLMNQLSDEEKKERQRSELLMRYNEFLAKADRCQENILNLESRMAEIKANIEKNTMEMARCRGEADALQKGVEEIPPSRAVEIRQEVVDAQQINKKVEHNKIVVLRQNDLALVKEQSDSCTKRLQEIEKERLNRMSNATMPIPGLAINEARQEILFNGIPFEQCSSSEQLRTSVAISMASNPTLRVMRSKEGSLLDHANLAMLADIVEQNHYQLWLERVGDGDECSVIISDGMVLAEEPESPSGEDFKGLPF
jgi:energy-coupling factor transporter ATP-binding protein EcfA2